MDGEALAFERGYAEGRVGPSAFFLANRSYTGTGGAGKSSRCGCALYLCIFMLSGTLEMIR